jgi:hypothetical protein
VIVTSCGLSTTRTELDGALLGMLPFYHTLVVVQ